MQRSKEFVKLLEQEYGHRRVDLRRKINQQVLSGGLYREIKSNLHTGGLGYVKPDPTGPGKNYLGKPLDTVYVISHVIDSDNTIRVRELNNEDTFHNIPVDYFIKISRSRSTNSKSKKKKKKKEPTSSGSSMEEMARMPTPCQVSEIKKPRKKRLAPPYNPEKCQNTIKKGLGEHHDVEYKSVHRKGKWVWRKVEQLEKRTVRKTKPSSTATAAVVDTRTPRERRKDRMKKMKEKKLGLRRFERKRRNNTRPKSLKRSKNTQKSTTQEHTFTRTKQPSTIPKIDGMGVKQLEKQLIHCMTKSKGMEKRIKDYQQKLKKCGKKKKTKKRNEDDFYEMPEERGEEAYHIEIIEEITEKQLGEAERVVNRTKRPVRIINLTGEGATAAARQQVEKRIGNDEVKILINGTDPDNIMKGKRKRMKREDRFDKEQARDVEGDKSSAVYKDRLALPWTVLENIGEDLWWYWNAYIWLTYDYYSKYDDNDGNHIPNSELEGKNVTKLLQDGELQERTSRLVELYLPEIFFFSEKGHPHTVWTKIDQDQASENLDHCLKSNGLVHKTRIFGENPDPRANDFVGKDESKKDAIISLYDRIKLVFKAYQYQAHTITNKNMYRRPTQVEEPNEDDYKILGLNKPEKKNLSDFLKNLKKVYIKKALQHHPDKGGDPKTFKEIEIATKRIETFLKHKGENVANKGDDYDHNLAIFENKYENTTEQDIKDWKYKSQVEEYNKLKKMHEDKAKKPWNDFLSTHAKKLPGGDNDAYADERPKQEDYTTTSSYKQAMKEYIDSLDKTFNEIKPGKLKEHFGRFREFERTNFTVYDSVQQIMKEGYPEDKAVHIYSHQQSCKSKEQQYCNYDDNAGKFSYTCMERTDDDEEYIGCFPVSLEGILYNDILWDENDVRKELGTDEWLVYKRNGEWVPVDGIYTYLSVTLDNIKERLRSGKVSVTQKELDALIEKEGGSTEDDDGEYSESESDTDEESDEESDEDDEEYLWELL
jgi:hypothetical protein